MDENELSAGYLKLPRAARYADVGETTLRRAAQAGEVRAVQAGKGGHWRFFAGDLDRWLAGEAPREDKVSV